MMSPENDGSVLDDEPRSMLFSGVLHLLLLLKLPEKASVVPLPGLSSFITHIWRILLLC